MQDHYLSGAIRAAAAEVPFGLIDETSLLGPMDRWTDGPMDRIADRLTAFAASGVTTLSVIPRRARRGSRQ
ncbi:hypothetical protein AQJ67_16380 [Streptomyces caeruleatus]|uniref:Uncharacterized protein n=1 Tax=Streptomyces caeruleatus TaxID=661399 RepID=A0A117RQ89_9ACTN|nr:hypothetical protein AQJ67_16380 [Streptomyces caeruleatus]